MSPSLKQIGSIIVTFLVYAFLVPPAPNWAAAAMLVVGVGFHEMSHLWAAKHLGLRTKGFYLVPFMGGVAFIEGPYKRYSQQAFVVLLGPVGGGLLALVTAAAYYLTGLPFLAAAASWMCFLNLFNLLPLSFMDGGQLMDTVAYSLNRTLGMVLHVGSTLIAAVVLWHFNPVLTFLVCIFGGSSVLLEIRNWKAFREGKTYLCPDSYLYPPTALSKKQMAMTVAGWLSTVVILGGVYFVLSSVPAANLSTIIHR
jgi:Zn-dependent protease